MAQYLVRTWSWTELGQSLPYGTAFSPSTPTASPLTVPKGTVAYSSGTSQDLQVDDSRVLLPLKLKIRLRDTIGHVNWKPVPSPNNSVTFSFSVVLVCRQSSIFKYSWGWPPTLDALAWSESTINTQQDSSPSVPKPFTVDCFSDCK